MDSADAPVRFGVEGAIATVTLNRPDTLNAMSDALMQAISEAFDAVEKNNDIRAVVLTGAGRGFCSGADLRAAATTPSFGSSATGSMNDVFNPALKALNDCPVPTIARINGAAAGGGMGLALACDITIAARSAFFVATFGPRLGIVPDMGATWSIPARVGRARALGITLLGDRITADEAQDWGLIWRAVDDAALDDTVADIAARLARMSPDAAYRIRRSIDAAQNNGFAEQLDLEMLHQRELIPHNMRTGAEAFVNRTEPVFAGRRTDPEER